MGARARSAIARGRMGASLLRLAAGVLLFIARVDEALVAHQQVAARKRLGAYLADKGLLLGVGADVSLQMFLWARD